LRLRVGSGPIAIGMSVWRAREAKVVTTYGSARWATREEIRSAGLLCPDGVVLGRHARDYLRHDGPEHVLCFAPTRSGKGVGLVVPTLLAWPGSAVVHDIKGENWQLTAGWRARFGRVLLFDPTNLQSAAYNPLLEVRRGDTEVRDAQNVADILVDPEGALERRNHWEKTSHSLLVGAILHVLYAEADKTLAGVAKFLSDPTREIEKTLKAMMATRHLGDRPHPVVASAARIRGFVVLPLVLLLRRWSADLMADIIGHDLIPGYEAPVHRSLTEPILLAGAPRAVAILNGTLSAAIGLGLRLWIAGLVLWAIGHMAAVWAAKRDPLFVEVVRRHVRYPVHLRP
jgi:type IV secretory pathway TrbD component